MNTKIIVYMMVALMIIPAIGLITQAEEQTIETNYVTRTPIRINNDSEFNISNGVSSGNGTEFNPYIIENWEIDGFGLGSCIFVGNTSSYVIIQNCDVYNALGGWMHDYDMDAGIYLFNSTNVSIYNTKIHDNDMVGIAILDILYERDSNIVIYNNTIYGHYMEAGLFLRSVDNAVVEFNTFYNNTGATIFLEDSSSNYISNNDITTNYLFSQKVGIYLRDNDLNHTYYNSPCSYNIINNNEIENMNTGIWLDGATDTNITNNFIHEYEYEGMYLYNVSRGNIINNSVQGYTTTGWTDYTYGIYLDNTNNISISENNIHRNNYTGLFMCDSMYNLVYGNDVHHNNKAGIELSDNTYYNEIYSCFIYNNDKGISCGESFAPSLYNIIKENYILANYNYGIYLSDYSAYTLIYNNDIEGNLIQAFNSVNPNDWNYTIQWGGNYWDDYVGVDLNNDGYGDVPYSDMINVVDYYPLMDSYTTYSFPQKYHLPIIITDDTEFTLENGVSSGTGTPVDPYIIENWIINGTDTTYYSGITLDSTQSYCIIRNCEIFGFRYEEHSSGIDIISSSNIIIEDCEVYDNNIGIHVWDGVNIEINDCYLEENGYINTGGGGFITTGIFVASSSYVTIFNNYLYNEQTVAIHVYSSINCTVIYNTVLDAVESGILIERTEYSLIYNNYVSGCLNGFYGKGSILSESMKYNIISGNTFTNSTEKGMFMYNTENNTIHHNNFINNDVNIIEYNDISFNGGVYTNVYFDNNNEGNYYDDFSSEDPEAVYTIYSDVGKTTQTNYDMFPLSAPYVAPEDTEEESEEAFTFGQIIIIMLISLLPVLIIIVVFKHIFGVFEGIGDVTKGNKGGK